MGQAPDHGSAAERPLRVLVVDNDPEYRRAFAELLAEWGCAPYVAQQFGLALLTEAKRLAQTHRCQIALVDMRLLDDHNQRDLSGLELVAQLKPCESIIVSGFGDRKAARNALVQYGAFDFVGKEDGPDALRDALTALADKLGIGVKRPKIHWAYDLTSVAIRDRMFPGALEIPPDEAVELIERLFKGKERIGLTLISNDGIPSERYSAPRRQSHVFRARVDNLGAELVVKISRADKIARETANFDNYVNMQFASQFVVQKHGELVLWDMGAVAYSYMGVDASMGAPKGPQPFTEHYRGTAEAEAILRPLQSFFHDNNWGNYYRTGVQLGHGSMLQAYDRTWNGALKEFFAIWAAEAPRLSVPELRLDLPNPTRWLVEHADQVELIAWREAVTHGDLHGDNLYVDSEHAWPIDFERTAKGPILRDFVELTHDVLTRLVELGDNDIKQFFGIAVSVCEPAAPLDKQARLRPAPCCWHEASSMKTLHVIEGLLHIAYDRARYDDQLEFLWGLLLNSVFVITLLEPGKPQRRRSEILAAVICARLESREQWPPASWERLLAAVTPPEPQRSHRTSAELRRAVEAHFSLEELQRFCHDLDVEFDNLPGSTLAQKALELVRYMERRERVAELDAAVP
jgi:DNA-binding response OmpR family regulator